MTWKNFVEKVKDTFSFASDRDGNVPVRAANDDSETMDARVWDRAAADILENDNELLFRFDVPGSTAQTTTVTFGEGPTLTIHARQSADDVDHGYHRSFRVPRSVRLEGATARVEQGVLTVHVPKAAAPEPRLIPVRAG